VVLEISIRRASPSAIAATASRMTTGAAQLPPIHPVSFPSGVMIAFAPGFADVGRSARTTVAVREGLASREELGGELEERGGHAASARRSGPAAADASQELRDARESIERVRR